MRTIQFMCRQWLSLLRVPNLIQQLTRWAQIGTERQAAPAPARAEHRPRNARSPAWGQATLGLFLICFGMLLPAGEVANDDAERSAIEAITALENRMREARALANPVERLRRERALLPTLERTQARCMNTRLDNKATYLLAEWRLNYGDDSELASILPLLDRIDGSPTMSYREAARILRARILLRLGRAADARKLAEGAVRNTPEFAPILDLVAFHERVGQPAPRTRGRNVSGGPEDPAAVRTEPWLLLIFAEFADGLQQTLLVERLNQLTDARFEGLLRPVLISLDGDPLAALTAVRALPGGADLDLIWTNPGVGGDREAWRREWGFATLPASVLLGPDRTVMAVEPGTDRLRALAGVPAANPNRTLDWRGRSRR